MLFDEENERDEAALREKEIQQINVALREGIKFTAGKRVFYIPPPCLGTMDYLAREFVQLEFSQTELESEDKMRVFEEQKRVAFLNVRRCAKIAAIAYLKSEWRIKLLTPWYTRVFMWNMTPEDLTKLTNIIIQTAGIADFMNSIILLRVNRTSAPKMIED